MIMNSGFSGLSLSFTPAIQFWIHVRHSVSSAKLQSKFLWSSARYIWVSSAYRWWVTLKLEMILLRGVVWRVKRRGPRTEPWGTPYGSEKASEKLLPNLTFCLQFERLDLIHFNTMPSTPNQSLSELKRMSWSIVSNADERSSNVSVTALPESMETAMSFWISGVLILWNGVSYRQIG